MIEVQIRLLTTWAAARRTIIERAADDRGEVTAYTVMLVLMVAAALTVGGIIAAKMIGEANKIPAG
jgi:hypothetical protein